MNDVCLEGIRALFRDKPDAWVDEATARLLGLEVSRYRNGTRFMLFLGDACVTYGWDDETGRTCMRKYLVSHVLYKLEQETKYGAPL